MVEKKKEPKIEKIVRYDERRKELIHTVKEEKDTEIGHLALTSIATINEEGIKKTIKSLNERRNEIGKEIKNLKENLKEIPEMSDELKKLKEKMDVMVKIIRSDKQKVMLQAKETELKEIVSDINEIKRAIGNRLNI